MTRTHAATGFTRARSMGRIAQAVRRAGGSVERVFQRAGLPLALVDHPDQVILLRDQFALVEHAAQAIGDDALAPRLSLQAGVTQLMHLALLDGRPTIAWMSRRLGLAARTLQRRLALAGGGFDALREQALATRAAELLRASRLSITDIAYELGYAEPAHFTRAARRWSGMAPRTWRQGLRSGDAAGAHG